MASDDERTKLNSYRYGFTVLSSVLVYAIAFGLLKSSSQDELGYHDAKVFGTLAIVNVSIGSIFVGLFHWFVPEEKYSAQSVYHDIENEEQLVADDSDTDDSNMATTVA